MKDIYKFIGQKVKQERSRLDLTQEELADKSGIGSKFISGIERGVSKPSLDTILKISDALKMSVSEIFSKIPTISKTSKPYTKKVEYLLKNMSNQEIRKVSEIIKVISKKP